MNLKDFMEALVMATDAHSKQKRWNGDPYIIHPLRVAKITDVQGLTDSEGYEVLIAAVLHDAVEDAKDPKAMEILVRAKFGDVVADAVVALSRIGNETYRAFVRRAKENPIARLVKIADIQDNLIDLAEDHGLRDRYEPALEFLQKEKASDY